MRTQFVGVERSEFNSKFSVKFETLRGTPGSEYVAASCESAPVFETEDEAYDGAIRALDHLEKTDRFPNMCEKF